MYLNEVNEEIRKVNAIRFENKVKEDLDKRIPWGADQEKLKNYAINFFKLYKKKQNKK